MIHRLSTIRDELKCVQNKKDKILHCEWKQLETEAMDIFLFFNLCKRVYFMPCMFLLIKTGK